MTSSKHGGQVAEQRVACVFQSGHSHRDIAFLDHDVYVAMAPRLVAEGSIQEGADLILCHGHTTDELFYAVLFNAFHAARCVACHGGSLIFHYKGIPRRRILE
jgi:hypothetical protein